jgi:hypothetical protein
MLHPDFLFLLINYSLYVKLSIWGMNLIFSY